FLPIWARGIPVVISHVNRQFQGTWTPAYFSDNFGSNPVKLTDCETEEEVNATVAEFFDSFGSYHANPHHPGKDWPPNADFEAIFPELHDAFKFGVPVQDYTRPDGVCNLISHFPMSSVKPDIGPKLYNAYGTEQIDARHGSTRLHLDVTGAINIALSVGNSGAGEAGGALWHIFAREDVTGLRAFLRTVQSTPEIGDPIHNQSIYLTPSMLESLARDHNIRPFTIRQRVWDAVFIPAGCPHQVSNETDTIKIACDFLSVEDVAASIRVASELRMQRLARGFGDDVLQLTNCLWYAWLSLRHHQAKQTLDDRVDALRLKRKKRRERQAMRLRVPTSDHGFECPFCPMETWYSQTGLVDHT
ncbi:hypothetical protein BV25DRAFT_1808342, partial [Artomyces pyxidatus]